MFNLFGKKRSELSPEELALVEATCADYWQKSRTLESETVGDLEKHLWLANGAAATASIGFVQARELVPLWQYVGTCAFVAGILALVVMKFVSAVNSSRDRYRFQDAKSRFDAGETTDDVFRHVRDCKFKAMKWAYLALQWGSGGAFVAGLVLTLIGVAHAV